MAPFYLVLALVIQCAFLHADTDVSEDKEVAREALFNSDVEDDVKEPMPIPNWFNMFMLPNNSSPFMFPSSSASMMAQITSANKTIEEQLLDIKELAKQISELLENEMVNLFSDVMAKEKDNEKETDENGIRKRRSIETPLDSSKMVMRLLKHIKHNNEYQNIAIDKMMTAQEIAEKYGIEFNPDPEILSELAVAATEHAQEMTSMLRDACSLKNITVEEVDFVPIEEEPRKEDKQYFSYVMEQNEPPFEYLPDVISRPKPIPHSHEPHSHSAPVHHHHSAPVSPRPSFYDSFMYPYSPATDYYGTYSMEPVILIPVEEDLEPELVGEVVEETVTSKMIVEKGEEPGATSVNHVTTYTVSEKSLFKKPQELPQHFQYCFYLM